MYITYIYVCKYVCVYTYINNSNHPLIPDGLLMGFLIVKIKYFLLLYINKTKQPPPKKNSQQKTRTHKHKIN